MTITEAKKKENNHQEMLSDKFKTKGLNPKEYKVIKITVNLVSDENYNVICTLQSLNEKINETITDDVDFILNNFIRI